MNVKPIRDRILVKPAEAETTTKGGLVIPDNAKEGPTKGTVLITGSGKVTDDGITIPLIVKEGDTVMYSKGAGVSVKLDDQALLILTEDQILAVVD